MESPKISKFTVKQILAQVMGKPRADQFLEDVQHQIDVEGLRGDDLRFYIRTSLEKIPEVNPRDREAFILILAIAVLANVDDF